jgi:hypothetical protein
VNVSEFVLECFAEAAHFGRRNLWFRGGQYEERGELSFGFRFAGEPTYVTDTSLRRKGRSYGTTTERQPTRVTGPRKNYDLKVGPHSHKGRKILRATADMIRADHRRGDSVRKLALRYGISKSQVHNVVTGRHHVI